MRFPLMLFLIEIDIDILVKRRRLRRGVFYAEHKIFKFWEMFLYDQCSIWLLQAGL